MTSPCSSSSSSRHDRPVWKPPGTSHKKGFHSIDEFINSYLTENLLRPQLRNLNKSSVACSQSNSDGEVPSRDRSENSRRTKIRSKTETKRLNELTKEVDKMLSRVKSKRQTNDILQLFKNTLNNFIIPEHPMDSNNNSNTRLKSEFTRENQTVLPMSSTYHQDHYNVQTSQETNEIHPYEQNLFSNRETSVAIKETSTRCKIKEPRKNTLGPSNTNMLHRCYGKQSVKASPQVHKSRKKNNSSCTNTNCQRPHMGKSKSQKLPKQQTKMINQQMKTIYENIQFDKSEKLIPENLEDMNELICDSTSHSSVESDKMSAIGTQINNEICNAKNDKFMQNSHKLETMTIDEWPSESEIIIEPEDTNIKIKNHQTIIKEMNSQQDNSIVQRLTSFWNKKLNSAEQSKSTSDPSIVNSSLTSVSEEDEKECEHMNQKCVTGSYNHKTSSNKMDEFDDESLINNDTKLLRDNIRNKSNNNDKEFIKNLFNGSEKKDDGCKQLPQNVGIPELKAGLVDELLTVLRRRDNVVSKHIKVSNKDKVKEITNYEQNVTNYDQNGIHSELNNLISKRFHNSVEVDSTGVKSEHSDEYNVDSKVDDNSDVDCNNNNDDFDVGIDDEQTFEVIERCLLEDMNNENEKYVKNQSDFIVKEPAKNIIKIPTLSNDFNDGMVRNEIKVNDKNYFTSQSEKNYDELNFSLNDHCSVITNVNCIINNLKELIHTVESIPEELKCVDMNLNCLPIPDKIKRKISSLIVAPNTESKRSRLSFAKPLDEIDPQLRLLIPPAEKNQLFRCCSSGKLLGYSKKEGYICKLYFPKLLAKPIIQNIKNPIQKILFPKRIDYLKMKASKFNNINRLDISNKSSDSVIKDCKDKIESDKADFARNNDNNDESVVIQEYRDIFEENLQQKNNCIADKEEQIIENCISATTVIKASSTQSSIFYVTPPPNSIVMQLLPSNKPEDEHYAKLKGTSSSKFFESTPGVSNKTFKNSKSNLKLEENFFIENSSVNNSVEELSDVMSIFSYTPLNSIQPEEFTVNDIHTNDPNNSIVCFPDENNRLREEIIINVDENRLALPNDWVLPNRRYGRKRRNRLYNNLDNDNTILNGGSGDSMNNCSDSIASSAIPCHHTSSMSVIVSNSINDSTSQSDINVIESECNLSRVRMNLHYNTVSRSVSPQDFDSFSICNVIQEEDSDEQLSEIDDFFMIKEQTSKVEINKTISSTVSSASILSQNSDLSNNFTQHEQPIPEQIIMCHKSSDHINNELSCNNQFTFQNLKNKIIEETSLIKQNLSNVEHNADNLGNENCDVNERCDRNENCANNDDKNFCFESVLNFEGNTEKSDEVISFQQELELPGTSFLSENTSFNASSNINGINLSHSNRSINKNSVIASVNNDDIYSDEALLNLIGINYEDGISEIETIKTESDKSIIKKKDFFHQSYHALFFEMDFSNDGQKAMADEIIINSYKNKVDKILENDPAIKKELSKIIDIDNLCEKDKQMMAACIYLMSKKFCDKSSTSPSTSNHYLSLASKMNNMWDKTISSAKKSLMPYDFETESLLYRRRYRKLCKVFYSLFVSLLLVFVMQKHIFGILLPVSFPW